MTKQVEHTPGPWKVSDEINDGWRMVVTERGVPLANINPHAGASITETFPPPDAKEEPPSIARQASSAANARLIAAAPDLLYVAKYARLVACDPAEVQRDPAAKRLLELCDAAIAKATNAGGGA